MPYSSDWSKNISKNRYVMLTAALAVILISGLLAYALLQNGRYEILPDRYSVWVLDTRTGVAKEFNGLGKVIHTIRFGEKEQLERPQSGSNQVNPYENDEIWQKAFGQDQ